LTALAKLFVIFGFALIGAAAHAATTLSASPTSVAPGGTVTATWSGIPTPTSTDWLALTTPGACNTCYLTYRYTNGAASGSVPFTIPSWVTPGTYILRLFANNGYTLLATSNNFTVTVTISGTVAVGGSGLSGVAFTATNGGTCTASNASGQYSCGVPPGWSGSVTPSLTGYGFTPASRNYTNVTANQTAQNYTATALFQVSGTVTVGGSPLTGVAFAATNGVTCTSSDTSGQYSCTVPQGWSGTVTPSLGGYSITPVSRDYTNVTTSQTGQDYTAAATAAWGIFYIHADHLNTPRLITNQTSQAVWRWDQVDPFGANAANENPSGLGIFSCNLRLPGQYFDKETNLHYNYQRDAYDSAIGRYAQFDPIGLRGGINGYAYVGNNPLSYVDPLGLKPRGSWINGTPSLASGSFSNLGASFMSPKFDWFGYLQIVRVSGTVGGVIQASVRCVDDENCSQQSWEMHRDYPVSVSGSVGVGPNLYATAIGLRFGPYAAIGANVVLATAKTGYAGYQLYNRYGTVGSLVLGALLSYGPDYICNSGFPDLSGVMQ
jgi:RHS repeat-associated protein